MSASQREFYSEIKRNPAESKKTIRIRFKTCQEMDKTKYLSKVT